MVDQAAQDAVEVEPAADIAGDPAQGLGAVEQVADLVLASGHAHDRADRVGEHGGEVEVGGAEAVDPVARRGAARPTAVGTGDRHRELRERAREVGRGDAFGRAREQGDGRGRRRPSAPGRGCDAASRARPRTPNVARQLEQARGRDARATAVARGVKPVALQRPHRHEDALGRRAHIVGDLQEVGVEVPAGHGQARHAVEQGEVAPVALDIERIGAREGAAGVHDAVAGAVAGDCVRAAVLMTGGSGRRGRRSGRSPRRRGSAAGHPADSAGRRER